MSLDVYSYEGEILKEKSNKKQSNYLFMKFKSTNFKNLFHKSYKYGILLETEGI